MIIKIAIVLDSAIVHKDRGFGRLFTYYLFSHLEPIILSRVAQYSLCTVKCDI